MSDACMCAIVAKLNGLEKCTIVDETPSFKANQFPMAGKINMIFVRIKSKQFRAGQTVLCLSDMTGKYFDSTS